MKITSKGQHIGKPEDKLYNHFVYINHIGSHLDGVRISDTIQHVEQFDLEITQVDILKDYEELVELNKRRVELEKSLERRILPLVVNQAIRLETKERTNNE